MELSSKEKIQLVSQLRKQVDCSISKAKQALEENKFDLSIKYYEEMFNIKASSFIGFANLLAFNKISLILEKILYFFFKDNKIVSPSTMEHLKQYIDDNSEDIWIKLFMG